MPSTARRRRCAGRLSRRTGSFHLSQGAIPKEPSRRSTGTTTASSSATAPPPTGSSRRTSALPDLARREPDLRSPTSPEPASAT
jgi:hypothetical protein